MPRFRPHLVSVVALLIATSASAQAPAASTQDSVGRAVQKFYDWYVPRAAKPGKQDMIMFAATHGPLPFDTLLVHWLRVDSIARVKAKGEVDGLDGDPYLNSQDPCKAYTVKGVRAQGADVLVDISGHGGCETRPKPDATMVFKLKAGHWTLVDVLDPSDKNQGLLALLKVLHPKAH